MDWSGQFNMRANEFVNNSVLLEFETISLSKNQILPYVKQRQKLMNSRSGDLGYFSPGTYSSGIKRYLNEGEEHVEIKPWIDRLLSLGSTKRIKVGDSFSVLEFEIGFGWREITVTGHLTPKLITKINVASSGKISTIEFEDGSRYPRQPPARYEGRPIEYALYFNSTQKAKSAMSFLSLSLPHGWSLNYSDWFGNDANLTEGGWASTLTQSTKITPQLTANVMKSLTTHFIPHLNKFLESKGLAPTEISAPGGSATYYQRDLDQDPAREYGDVDVQFHIARIPEVTNNKNRDIYKQAIIEFCNQTDQYSSENGVNVILKVPEGYVQIDLVYSFYENKEWTNALRPEWRVKGVLCNSLYSSLGEALNISFGGGEGIQVKTQGGNIVPFRTVKDVDLHTISNNPRTWAVDIASYFGGKMNQQLKKYPGLLDEVRVSDIINSFKGIAQSLETAGKANAKELLGRVRDIYLAKIEKAATSSKYDKAATPEAQEKAQHTKEMLLQKSQEFARMF